MLIQRSRSIRASIWILLWIIVTISLPSKSYGASDVYLNIKEVQTPIQRVAFGSCNDQIEKQPLWPLILKRDPQLWLWTGDNIYADYKDYKDPTAWFSSAKVFYEATPQMLLDKYKDLEADPGYNMLRQQVPIIGTWDDHDYGINDGDRTYTYRKESQSIMLDFLGEPSDSPRRVQEGVYTSYTIGKEAKSVRFILLDVRYHKDPYDQVDGDFLGEAQWEWLEKELYESKASFNVIVSGIQVLPEDRFFGGENWHRFPQQRLRLLHLILKSNAKGVVLLSGDVHFAEINQIQCDGGTSRRSIITEVTNSGMTHSWDHNPSSNSKWPSIAVLIFHVANRLLPMEFRRKIDHFYSKLHFGELAFYWNEAPFPVMTVNIIGMDNKAHLEYNISSISYIDGMMNTSTSNITCRPIREMPKPLAYIRHGLYNSISWVLVGIYPFTLSLILALLLYVAMKIRERCHKRNVIKVD